MQNTRCLMDIDSVDGTSLYWVDLGTDRHLQASKEGEGPKYLFIHASIHTHALRFFGLFPNAEMKSLRPFRISAFSGLSSSHIGRD